MQKCILSLAVVLTLFLTLALSACDTKSISDTQALNVPSAVQSQSADLNTADTEEQSKSIHEAQKNIEAEPADMFTYEFGRAYEGGHLSDGGNGTWINEEQEPIDIYAEGIILTSYRGTKTQLKVPDTIEGYPVVGIDGECFAVGVVTDVYFPDTVKYFEWGHSTTSVLSGELKIPNGVTIIVGPYNYGISPKTIVQNITKVVIPDTVSIIDSFAFKDLKSLTGIIIPDSVTKIGSSAFEDCQSLLQINLPADLAEIGENAFTGTSWLDAQPNGMIYVNKIAYTYKGEMPPDTNIIIKDGTLVIADEAFGAIRSGLYIGQTSLNSITIPYSVTKIGVRAFAGCSSLKGITIPSSVIKIGISAFGGCTSLKELTIPGGVTEINATILQGCSSLKSITLPNGITKIGNYAFDGCSALTDITIPDSVTSIGEYSFQGCTELDEAVRKQILSINPNASLDNLNRGAR
jgi:hypothetical protein